MATFYGSSAVLKSTRDCTMLGVVDKMRRTYRHHGWQRDALRRIATFRHATLRVAAHRYATLEPLGKPGGSRAFSKEGPLNDASVESRQAESGDKNPKGALASSFPSPTRESEGAGDGRSGSPLSNIRPTGNSVVQFRPVSATPAR